jgi:hypothetical protein
MGFMETSAKSKVNVEETFALIVRRVVLARKAAQEQPQQFGRGQERRGERYAEKGFDEEKQRGGCCKCCTIS